MRDVTTRILFILSGLLMIVDGLTVGSVAYYYSDLEGMPLEFILSIMITIIGVLLVRTGWMEMMYENKQDDNWKNIDRDWEIDDER